MGGNLVPHCVQRCGAYHYDGNVVGDVVVVFPVFSGNRKKLVEISVKVLSSLFCNYACSVRSLTFKETP